MRDARTFGASFCPKSGGWAAVALALACAAVGCKAKPAPPAAAAAADASAAVSAGPLGADAAAPANGAARAARSDRSATWVTDAAVSSRVDNDRDRPAFLGDGDLDTAWSSKSGDLEGAWVELRVRGQGSLSAVYMTVGMTKKPAAEGDPDLFVQNPRVAEVGVTWTPIVALPQWKEKLGETTSLVERLALDTESRALQKVPFASPTSGAGVLRITVQKLKMGTKPAWREVSISEIALREGPSSGVLTQTVTVGSLDPKPRGTLGIIPERRAPFGCLAYVPSAPRVYCVLGYTAFLGVNRTNAGELVTIDRAGVKRLAVLFEAAPYDHQVPYGAWLRTERELKGEGRPVERTGARSIPGDGSIDVGGATFRQRSTLDGADAGDDVAYVNSVLEVRWTPEGAFSKLFDAFPIVATQPIVATIRPLGELWLVERLMAHGSEGMGAQGAQASFCDLAAKKCTPYSVPEPESNGEPR